jgi:hypothetical protein
MDYKNENDKLLKLKKATVYDLDINPERKSANHAPLGSDRYSKTTEPINYTNPHERIQLSESLRKAQDQLGLCLQKQRQIGFILKEVKGILKN